MIQSAMLLALGALATCLLWLALLPLVARRSERRARARLEQQMPLSAPEIAAERDQLRAGHAVEVRQLEQRLERTSHRVAVLLGDAGRQGTRLALLERQARADADTIRDLAAEREHMVRSLRGSEATLGTQELILHDAYLASERRRELLEVATARLAEAEALLGDQRSVIAELERSVEARAARSSLAPSSATTDEGVQLRAAYGRLRADHDILRKANDAMTSERERLRFRIDELLLRLEEVHDQAEEARDTAAEQERRAIQQDRTIAALNTRIAAREEALATVKRRLAEEAARHQDAEIEQDQSVDVLALRNDPAVLRRAISALAADLVRASGADQDPPAEGLPSRPAAAAR